MCLLIGDNQIGFGNQLGKYQIEPRDYQRKLDSNNDFQLVIDMPDFTAGIKVLSICRRINHVLSKSTVTFIHNLVLIYRNLNHIRRVHTYN